MKKVGAIGREYAKIANLKLAIIGLPLAADFGKGLSVINLISVRRVCNKLKFGQDHTLKSDTEELAAEIILKIQRHA